MRDQRKRVWWFLILNLVLSVTTVIAQSTCPELVERALASVDQNCGGLGRNEACYGYNRVEASFLTPVADDFFAEPADVVGVGELSSIRTTPLDEANDQWGVAVMTLQASLPDTLPGQNVTFILLGDAEVENAVAPEDAFVPGAGIDVTVQPAAGANVRSGPSTNFNVVGGVQRGSTLKADGISEDEAWLRVVYLDRPGWVSRELVSSTANIEELPVLTDQLRTPMQAFYLRTGIGQPSCSEVPDDLLLVQGPENIEIDLTVNGANIQLGSSGALRVVEVDGQSFLEITVFDGEFEVDGVVIRQGQRSRMCLGQGDNRGLDGQSNDQIVTCAPSAPERIPAGEFGESWCLIEEMPLSVLNYNLEILCPDELAAQQRANNANNNASNSQLDAVDCSTFGLIGPFSGISPRPTVFSWTPAEGATDYEVVFYNYQGGVAQTFFTPNTSIELNVGEIPTGSDLAWEVRAYRNGEYACVTGRTQTITRVADPQAPLVIAGRFTPTVSCSYGFKGWNLNFSWTGLGNETLNVSAYDSAGGSASGTYSGDTGSGYLFINVFSIPAGLNVSMTTSDGQSYYQFCP